MKCNIKVSIVTPVLNGSKTVRFTIESVLNQTYKNIEYIIVDGGSTDGTIEIIKEYVPLFGGRLKYISESDNGIYNAMNKGIKMTEGSLIGIINSDDYYEKDAVEKIVNSLSKQGEQLVYGYCRIIGKHNEEISINRISHDDIFHKLFMHPTCFITRKTYCKYGLYNEHFRVAADCELIYRLYRKGVSFTQVKCIIANYRIGGYSCVVQHQAELEFARLIRGGDNLFSFIKKALMELLQYGIS